MIAGIWAFVASFWNPAWIAFWAPLLTAKTAVKAAWGWRSFGRPRKITGTIDLSHDSIRDKGQSWKPISAWAPCGAQWEWIALHVNGMWRWLDPDDSDNPKALRSYIEMTYPREMGPIRIEWGAISSDSPMPVGPLSLGLVSAFWGLFFLLLAAAFGQAWAWPLFALNAAYALGALAGRLLPGFGGNGILLTSTTIERLDSASKKSLDWRSPEAKLTRSGKGQAQTLRIRLGKDVALIPSWTPNFPLIQGSESLSGPVPEGGPSHGE